ncbi:MAG: hypothetical protein QGF09_02295 [Rhodospirillales bacterium]|nr:hypothetical protein [Rhodospirillales bacterium]
MFRILAALFLGAIFLGGVAGPADAQSRRSKTKCVHNPLFDYPNAARTGKCKKKRADTKAKRGALSQQQKRAKEALRLEQEARTLEILQRTRTLLDKQKALTRTVTPRRTQ